MKNICFRGRDTYLLLRCQPVFLQDANSSKGAKWHNYSNPVKNKPQKNPKQNKQKR